MTDATIDDPTTLTGQLSREEKVALLSGRDFWHLEAIPSVGLPAVMVTDGPHGLRKQGGAGDHLGLGEAVPATCFPTAVGLGATFDVDLLEEVGRALGRETQAEDVGVLLGPGLNLKRHPAGGRNFEYLSEDPVVAGHLAAALVRGIQAEGVGACLKHLAANHQEAARMTVDTIVDERSLRELELTGFELAVQLGQPWTVMSGYNRLNGTYCSDHRWLLTEWLRDTVGFDGLVMTDWGGMNDRVAATQAGCDLEMPGSGGAFDAEVLAALADGSLSEAALDTCVQRVVELIVRVRANRRPALRVDHDAHHALARRAAVASTVLLTNDGILPLLGDRAASDPAIGADAASGADPATATDADALGSLAVIGSFAVDPRFQGAGSSQVRPTRIDALLPSLWARLGPGADLRYAAGYDADTGTSTDHLIAEAAVVAREAARAVVLVGLPGRYESEGFDRAHLQLPPGHTRLVEAVLDANPRTVVVLTNGAPVELPWAERPAALVEGYLGGQATGSALADVLLGDAEPGGRLAESFPVAVDDLPADANMPGHPRQVEHREGLFVGYRFHDTAGVPARFPFGHGLGYTTITIDDVEVTGEGTARTVRVRATNTGARAGSEVVQLYVRDPEASVPRPAKELKGFAKLHLDAGASGEVTIDLDARAFAFFDPDRDGWVVEAGTFELLVGTSSTTIHHTVEVVLDADLAGVSAAPAVSLDAPAAAQPDASMGFVATDERFAAMLGRAVPTPRPVQPFHRNSTVRDLAETPAGRRLQSVILRAATKRTEAGTAEGDDATRRMFEAVVQEAPLRSLALLGDGPPSLATVDRATAVLNGAPTAALRGVIERWRRTD
ncbi:MAG: glycoside hydrolase family 3 C-terminal domain-containing protein [Nitriliruptoraceae bacterium]|nr:glycoside hydrolase family 3 C-terminal domain-containing protein [Nitriliruptoraceae bacterium]